MIKFLMGAAALALGLSVPALAATDGSPGATSTGSFDISLTVNPPATTTVQVLGLNNFDFGTVNTTNSGTTSVSAVSDSFCLNRSDAGNVKVVMTQAGVTSGNARMNGTGGFIEAILSINNPSGSGQGVTIGGAGITIPQSGAGCSATSGPGTAHLLRVSPVAIPGFATTALSGTYSGTVTMTVSVP